jgi:protein ImuA
MDKEQALAELKQRIRALESPARIDTPGVCLGIPKLDAALGSGGMPLACIHEMYGDGDDTTQAAGLVAAVLTLLPAGPVVWVSSEAALYLPGLMPFGIGSEDLLFVPLRKPTDRLWAMEEALRWPGLKAVVAELDSFDLTATRRLQLAAEGSGVTGFIIARREQGLSSGVTRWRVSPAPDDGWHIELSRCRSGRNAASIVQWRGHFISAADAASQRVTV